MTEGETDYETMKRVLQCENRRQVQEVLNDYKDVDFRDLFHTKQKLAQKLVACEKSERNKHFLHQGYYFKTFT